MSSPLGPEPLWSPPADRRRRSRLDALRRRRGVANYDELWRWSVDPATSGEFWLDVAEEFGVPVVAPDRPAWRTDPNRVPGVEWFPGATLNYADVALRGRADDDRAALVAHDDARGRTELSGAQLVALVGRLQHGLRERGVTVGDVVAGYLPNVPETVALMLATVSLGATWTCCAPETGADGVLDRLVQTAPRVLVTVDGYRYGERQRDLREDADRVRAGLPTVRHAVRLPLVGLPADPTWEQWDDLAAAGGPPEFTPVPFDHPLYVLYSSGTTGRPKAIVHGHGGIVLEHVKALGYHFDVGRDDTFFWYTTTGWMMWNFCVSGLLLGATVTLFDGHPAAPEPDRLWAFMAREGVTVGGVGAAYLVASAKAGVRPGRSHDLSRLLTLGSTGSPLPADTAAWVYHEVASDLLLASFSGGTDVCSGFVGGSPLHDVVAGEISCRCLGADVEVVDDDGRPVVDVEGELTLAHPLPSMPVRFLGDPDGARYRAAYFERFPGRWAHGDRATVTSRGTVVITGRSDGTLNRGGVRMGTAEFYAVVEALDEVEDSLVVHLEDPEGGPGELWLFVVVREGGDPATLEATVREALRRRLSPRHVPDRVIFVPSVPRTLSGKKMEVPVKRLLAGADPATVVTISSMANPESLAPILALAAAR